MLLAGGPGQPALPAFEALLAPLAREPALRSFELVAFDQRGTGQSQALECPEVGRSFKGGLTSYSARAAPRSAPRALSTPARNPSKTSTRCARRLGGTPLSLFAVSYGTRVAGMYAREHPQGVARMVLDSTTPTTGPGPLGIERLRALPRVLDEGICGAGACRSFSSDVYADLTRVVAVLHRHPLRTRIYNARGRLRPASVTEAGVLRLLFGLDLAHGARELAPAAIAAAAHGDAVPLARLTHALQSAPASSFASAKAGTAPPAAAFPPGRLGEPSFAAEAPVTRLSDLPPAVRRHLLRRGRTAVVAGAPLLPGAPRRCTAGSPRCLPGRPPRSPPPRLLPCLGSRCARTGPRRRPHRPPRRASRRLPR